MKLAIDIIDEKDLSNHLMTLSVGVAKKLVHKLYESNDGVKNIELKVRSSIKLSQSL